MRVRARFVITITFFACLAFLQIGCGTLPRGEAENTSHDDHDHEQPTDIDYNEQHASGNEEDHVHENPSTDGHAEIGEHEDKAFSVIDLETAPVTQIDFHEVIQATGKITNNQNNEEYC